MLKWPGYIICTIIGLYQVLTNECKMAAVSLRRRTRGRSRILGKKSASESLHRENIEDIKSPYFAVEEKSASKHLHFNAKRKKTDGDIAEQNNLKPVCRDRKLTRTFYDVTAEDLAKKLLGKILHRVLDNGEVLSGRIVETEAYLGVADKACHSYAGKRTTRTEPLYMSAGTAYVYIIYGMYHCLNISSKEPGACALIRALEPIKGLHLMKEQRGGRRRDNGAGLKDFQLCNGPSKLCQALCIEKGNLNKEDMALSQRFWLEEEDHTESNKDSTVVTTSRIGIDSYGQEWASKPLRFYIMGNKCISVRNKKAEEELDKQVSAGPSCSKYAD